MISMIGHICCHTIRKDHYIKYISRYWRHFRSTHKSAASCWNALSCPEKQLVGKIFLWSLHRCRISLGAGSSKSLNHEQAIGWRCGGWHNVLSMMYFENLENKPQKNRTLPPIDRGQKLCNGHLRFSKQVPPRKSSCLELRQALQKAIEPENAKIDSMIQKCTNH